MLSNYLMAELMDHAFRVGSFTMPTALYAGLSTTQPLPDGTGITAPSGGSYARVSASGKFAACTVANPAELTNNALITFPTPTASWDTPTWFVLYDHATAGNMLAAGRLKDPVLISTGDLVEFDIGDLTVAMRAF